MKAIIRLLPSRTLLRVAIFPPKDRGAEGHSGCVAS
jgi:hypothetical protein